MKKRKYVNLLAVLLVAFAFLFSFTACSDSSSSEREITDEDYRIIQSILEAFDEAETTRETVSSTSEYSATETCTSDSTVTVCLCDEDSCSSSTSCDCESCAAEHSSVTIYRGSYCTATVNLSSSNSAATMEYNISADVDGTSYTLIIKGTTSSYTMKLNGVTITGYDEYVDALDSDDE